MIQKLDDEGRVGSRDHDILCGVIWKVTFTTSVKLAILRYYNFFHLSPMHQKQDEEKVCAIDCDSEY